MYTWGYNDGAMLGLPAGMISSPTVPKRYTSPVGYTTSATPVNLTTSVTIVETGGHTSMIQESGNDQFCYTGHIINFSDGAHSTDNTWEGYDCDNTPAFAFCPACSVPAPTFSSSSITQCGSVTKAQMDALVSNTGSEPYTVSWFTDANGATAAPFPITASTTLYAKMSSTAANCTGPVSATGVAVTINPYPAAPTYSAGPLTNTCPSASITQAEADAKVTNASGGTISWYTTSDASTAVTFPITTSTTIWAKVTSTSGCSRIATTVLTVTVSTCCTAGNTAPVVQ